MRETGVIVSQAVPVAVAVDEDAGAQFLASGRSAACLARNLATAYRDLC